MKAPTNRHIADRGSATVVGAAIVTATALLLALIAAAGNLMVCRAHARSIADIAALAGATALYEAAGEPCVIALAVIDENGAALESCDIEGEEIQVKVRIPTGTPIVSHVVMRSRAGPVACSA